MVYLCYLFSEVSLCIAAICKFQRYYKFGYTEYFLEVLSLLFYKTVFMRELFGFKKGDTFVVHAFLGTYYLLGTSIVIYL